MHDDVGAKFQRLLQGRRAETVVHRQQRAASMGDLGQCGDIHQFGQRVGRRFDEQQLGVGFEGALPGIQIRQRYVIHFDAKALEVLLEQADGRTEYAARHQYMVTATAQAHDNGKNRRHTGGSGHRLLGAFQCGNALLEGTYGGVGVARIDVARHFPSKARSGIGSGAEHVTGRQVQRFAMLTLRRTVLAGTHRQGVEAYAIQVTIKPAGFPFHSHIATSQKGQDYCPARSNQLLYRSMIALTACDLTLLASLRACSILSR